ncbi:MAG: glycyl-radical enzyme activating protein [Bacillota bacterium]|nr:glycyl-radical enzyme activating protein [Bacillota bacterium]
MTEITALISNIQKYSIHDGPGIRTTVFFKGCPLLCAWCHNPETQVFNAEIKWQGDKCIGCLSCVAACPKQAISAAADGVAIDPELCGVCGACANICPSLAMELLGKSYTPKQLYAEIIKDALFYQQSGGGVTLSGGEPLSHDAFALALLQRLKADGIHTAVDTAGFVPWRVFEQLDPYIDLYLYDIKHLDSDIHEQYTRVPNQPILDNLQKLSQLAREIWLRIPLIPGVNDDPGHIRRIGELARRLGLREIYLLPYHRMAAAKYARLQLPYTLGALEEPQQQQLEELADILSATGANAHIGG